MRKIVRCLALFLMACTVCALFGCTGDAPKETESDTAKTEQPTSGATDAATEPATEPATGPAPETLPEGEVKVVSFNVDANLETLNTRAPVLVSTVLACDPDSFGVQEARPAWLTYLRKNLTGYDYIGISADGENPSTGTFGTYIFYKKDKYKVIDSGTFWLSKTTEIPSRYSNTVDCNRTCCWVILEDKQTGLRYVHMNSHLDWMDVKATDYQIGLIRDQILRYEAMGLPVFATGDYNTDQDSSTYHIMLEASSIADSKFVAEKTMNLGTYPSYGEYDCTKTKPIDFCFVTKAMMKVSEYRVIDDKPNGVAISDHYGLYIRATVKAEKAAYDAVSELAFAADSVKVSPISARTETVTFQAATGKVSVLRYTVCVKDESGKTVFEETVASGFRDPAPATSFSMIVSGLNPTTPYRVTVTAVDAYGNSADQTVGFTTEENTTAETIGAADLFDLVMAGNTYTDGAPAALGITVCGSGIKIDSDAAGSYLALNGNYNLKVADFKKQYAAMAKGFSMELAVHIGSDINSDQCYFSNMHAGGFGYELYNGVMEFYLRIGSAYQTVKTTVKANTDYHFLAVYDGAQLSLYVNGELVDSIHAGSDMVFATDPGAQYLCIGADSDASGAGEMPAGSGRIYTARIYSTPATAGQALWLWQHSPFYTA